MAVIVFWGLTAIAAALVAGIVAGVKNRDYSFWMAWCFLVPPLVVWLMIMPRLSGRRPRRPTLDELERNDSVT